MKVIQAIVNGASYIFFILLAIAAFFSISANTSLLGHYKSYVIQSGSMENTIMTGDIILTKSMPQYNKYDVITFKEAGERIVTHRIIQVNEGEAEKSDFITKGDANRSIDNDTVTQEQILGKVMFVVPKVGFLVAFAKSPFGLIILILIPSALLIIDRLIKMSQKT